MNDVNYDKVADGYEYRYDRSYQSNGLSKDLESILQSNDISSVLEVGCGTGHWLRLFPKHIKAIGIDKSFEMLGKANDQVGHYSLIQGDSCLLPFKSNSFDFVFCINAIHHFNNPEKFIKDCANILNPGGVFVNVCMNPHAMTDKWFIYDFFEGTFESDLFRYPDPKSLNGWLVEAGFSNIEFKVGERLQNVYIDEEVFPIPKDYTSQLTLLSDQEYSSGINKIKKAISLAKQVKKHVEFEVDISLSMVTAKTVD